MDSPVLIGLTVPGLLLHREKGRHQHNAGEAGIQEDREQQLRRKQLSCWSIWSQFRVGMIYAHWKTGICFSFRIWFLSLKDEMHSLLSLWVRLSLRKHQLQGYAYTSHYVTAHPFLLILVSSVALVLLSEVKGKGLIGPVIDYTMLIFFLWIQQRWYIEQDEQYHPN